MPIEKPSFPTLTPTQLQEGFDRLKGEVEDVRQKNGRLDVKKLAKKVAGNKDVAMQAAFDAIKDEFVTTERVRVSSGGCGGSYMTTRTGTPKKLDSDEVQTVLNALVRAKSRVGDLDKDGNQRIDSNEAQAAKKMRGFSGNLVKAAVHGSLKAYQRELQNWSNQLRRTAYTVDERVSVEDSITEVTGYHCQYQNGARAVAWALRELATRKNADIDVTYTAKDMLKNAEKGDKSNDANPLTRYFTYSDRDSHSLRKGHLNNAEVRDLLNTKDLGAFEKKMKRQVAKNTGASYAEYLQGAGLPGADQLDDPDFKSPPSYRTVSDSC